MKGKILAYCNDASTGIIADPATGKEYQFKKQDWISLGKRPEPGQIVVFDDHSDIARHVMAGASE